MDEVVKGQGWSDYMNSNDSPYQDKGKSFFPKFKMVGKNKAFVC